MTTANPLVEVLQERLRLVQDLSRVNARHLLNQQIAGGVEFEIMRVEREIREDGPSPARTVALREAQDRKQQAQAAMSADSESMAALEDRLTELDRRVAADDRKRGTT